MGIQGSRGRDVSPSAQYPTLQDLWTPWHPTPTPDPLFKLFPPPRPRSPALPDLIWEGWLKRHLREACLTPAPTFALHT